METKICTYTEKNVRLQLVRVVCDNSNTLEVRINRKLIASYSSINAFEAKLVFCLCVFKILIDRNLSDLTSYNTSRARVIT